MASYVARKPMFDGLDLTGMTTPAPADLTWDSVKRLRDLSSMKLVIQGVVTREDAELAVQHGVDGIVVSNHGGRGAESGRATVECLAEVVAGVGGTVPVLVDGGFRRGTDIFKALALGATAVGIGRPSLWGLDAFGQQGVETVPAILRREPATTMLQADTVAVGDVDASQLVDRGCW
jgi:isopentenyl diphosphate isomerase/L-lactate dehydrogenase-like FMN-dependent dehydrogenase